MDFADRELGELAPQDYQELGFLCGLEVHQQLLTRSKLFCRCPAGVRVQQHDAEVLRHMRPTLSEMGEYDGCALMEFKTRKEIVYLLEHGTVCTYEMDDTPPFAIDEEAVRQALLISRFFDLQLASELQVMRKQYLDGSIPTGFQRTAMVGIGGVIPFRDSELGRDRELRIRQLTLEEDSCREVADVGHRITFRTDRLGMPLIETVTEPDLLTPRDVALGGRLLAQVAQTSGHVRRGPGSGRQDVNVSIAGSRRVEIKGVGQHRLLPRLVHNEAYRHLNLLRIRQELRQRGLSPELRGDLHVDVTGLLGCCGCRPIEESVAAGNAVRAVRLPGFGGLLAYPTQPNTWFAQEFADRVRVIACLTGRPFMLSHDLPGHRELLLGNIWPEVRAALRADAEDSVVIVWGDPRDLDTAVQEILLRAEEAFSGVPSETRQAHPDGTTGFERILPGPERMYPDTDTPPLPIQDAWVQEIEQSRWEMPWARVDRYVKSGLSPAAANRLAAATWADLFDELAPQQPATAQRLAAALEKRLPHFWREAGVRDLPDAERLRGLVAALDAGEVHACGTEAVLDRLLWETDASASSIVDEHRLGDGSELVPRIQEILKQTACVAGRPSETALRWGMGMLFRGLPRGRFDPQAARQQLVGALEVKIS